MYCSLQFMTSKFCRLLEASLLTEPVSRSKANSLAYQPTICLHLCWQNFSSSLMPVAYIYCVLCCVLFQYTVSTSRLVFNNVQCADDICLQTEKINTQSDTIQKITTQLKRLKNNHLTALVFFLLYSVPYGWPFGANSSCADSRCAVNRESPSSVPRPGVSGRKRSNAGTAQDGSVGLVKKPAFM